MGIMRKKKVLLVGLARGLGGMLASSGLPSPRPGGRDQWSYRCHENLTRNPMAIFESALLPEHGLLNASMAAVRTEGVAIHQ